jgi:hypothetical protein
MQLSIKSHVHLILTAMMLCVSVVLSGQGAGGSKYLKVYLVGQYFDQTSETFNFDGDLEVGERDSKSFRLGYRPAFALQHQNGHRSEIELNTLSFRTKDHINLIDQNQRDLEGKTRTFELGLRYEYDYRVYPGDQLELFIGAAVLGVFSCESLKPDSDYLYDTRSSRFDLGLAIVPKLIIPLSEFVSLDVNIPVTVVNWSSLSKKYDSSVVPSGESKFSDSYTTTLPGVIELRVGLQVAF